MPQRGVGQFWYVGTNEGAPVLYSSVTGACVGTWVTVGSVANCCVMSFRVF